MPGVQDGRFQKESIASGSLLPNWVNYINNPEKLAAACILRLGVIGAVTSNRSRVVPSLRKILID